MEDDFNILANWKTTSISWLMKDDNNGDDDDDDDTTTMTTTTKITSTFRKF